MKANYGIDAPTVVLYLFIAGAGCVVTAFVPGLPSIAQAIFIWIGFSWLLTDLIMISGSKVFKLRLRDRLLDSLQLSGNERALDIGCGRGLMLIGLAKRLPNGKAVGIDLWNKSDQSGNTEQAALTNARKEKVEDRVEIETGDMRRMPFEHQSFDCVVSSWAIHNIQDAAGREAAVLEAVRVLKPGGRLAIVDIFNVKDYAETLRILRMDGITISKPNYLFLIPTRTVRAMKPIKATVDKNLTLS